MHKTKTKHKKPEMREEYDFTNAVRGKYVKRYPQGNNVVLLDPDVAKAFPDSESVNQALRALSKALSERGERSTK